MYFFVRTQNPRPTFLIDMTSEEREIMNRHIAYWTDKAAKGIVIAFGPVMDPKGVFGIGIFKGNSEHEINQLISEDPANGLLKYEIYQMPKAIIGQELDNDE